MVWLDDIADGAPRAGDLCTRHADALVPPKGWERVDRRTPTPVVVPQLVTSVHDTPERSDAPRRARRIPSDPGANLFDAAAEPDRPDEDETPAATVSWLPRHATEADLDGVLTASSPLLSRAFRNARGDDPDGDADDHVDPDAF